MENYVIALIGLAICIGAILLVSGVKMLIVKAAEAKKKEVSKNSLEYPLSLASLVLAYGGVVLFLKYGVMQDIGVALKTAVPFAMSVQTLYVFVVQLSRKGIKGIIAGVIHLVKKVKGSKNPIQELPAIAQEAAENVDNINEPADEDVKKIVSEVRNFFNK